MGGPGTDQAMVKDIQARIDKKMREQEIATIQHWKERIDRVASMKPEGVASLQLELKKISTMMDNRIGILKREP